jgi:L-threonylcarbamoyladenylate synthase
MDFSSDVEACLKALRKGDLILYPTDTIWGIGCDATHPQAVKRIYDLKQRPETKSLIVLLADDRDLSKYVSLPDDRIYDFLKKVHKPTTVIYQGPVNLAYNLTGSDDTIAIRVVKDSFCKKLIERFGKPIVSTSANLSGRPAPRFFDEVTNIILSGVEYVVKYRQSDKTEKEPSSVVQLKADGTVAILRQ